MHEVPPKDHHRHIPHDVMSDEPIQANVDNDIKPYEKHINALHNVILVKGQLPSFDPIRRAAEEVDGLFDRKEFTANIPGFLHSRLPEYSERRILAVETVLCELELVTREELSTGKVNPTSTATAQFSPYIYKVDTHTHPEPKYSIGNVVKVSEIEKSGHIRTPVYLLGKVGTIVNIQGMFLNPEDLAHFKPIVLNLPLYLVEFELKEVWGQRCSTKSIHDKIQIEIYEPWLLKYESKET